MLQLIVIWSLFFVLPLSCIYFAWRRNSAVLRLLLAIWLILMLGMLYTLMVGQSHRDAHERMRHLESQQQ